MKWHNCNIGFKVSINSGAALILYLGAFFLLTTEAAFFPAVERIYPVAVGALTGAFGGFLVKRASNNKLMNAENIQKLKIETGAPEEKKL